MKRFRLAGDIYTPTAIKNGIEAFANVCEATEHEEDGHAIITIGTADDVIHGELLNYILTLSAEELLR